MCLVPTASSYSEAPQAPRLVLGKIPPKALMRTNALSFFMTRGSFPSSPSPLFSRLPNSGPRCLWRGLSFMQKFQTLAVAVSASREEGACSVIPNGRDPSLPGMWQGQRGGALPGCHRCHAASGQFLGNSRAKTHSQTPSTVIFCLLLFAWFSAGRNFHSSRPAAGRSGGAHHFA